MLITNTTKKSEISVAAAGNGPLRIPTAPLTDVVVSPHKIADVLQHRRVCQVLSDQSFVRSFRGQHTAIDYNDLSRFEIKPDGPINHLLLDCSMTITNVSTFLRMLPDAEVQKTPAHPAHKATSLTKDLIVMDSLPFLEQNAFERLKSGLEFFRSAHPYAVVVASLPLDGKAALQMEVLRDKGLVDELGTEAHETSTQIMFRGAVILEQKLQKLDAAVHDKKVVLHCNPADVHETVLIEPIITQ